MEKIKLEGHIVPNFGIYSCALINFNIQLPKNLNKTMFYKLDIYVNKC